MRIEKGKRVVLEYELRVDGGDGVESSAKTGPIRYVHGDGKMLPGLERQIEGLSAGDDKEGLIMAAEAYGTEDSLPTKTLDRSEFPEGEEIKLGRRFEAKGPDGNPVEFVVIESDDQSVTIRFDHPLAGKDIRYKIKVLQVGEPGQPPPAPVE